MAIGLYKTNDGWVAFRTDRGAITLLESEQYRFQQLEPLLAYLPTKREYERRALWENDSLNSRTWSARSK